MWPVTEDITCEEEVNRERMKKLVSPMLTAGVSTFLNSHLADYKKAVNIMGWIRIFVYNCRHKQENKKGNLSVSDINEAEKTIVYLIQQESFAKGNNPPTAPPPADRVQDAPAFQIAGMDIAGPVILRDNSKAWIALFTCAMYRAVHLELVTSMSTETFLLAFHRFVARRGKPSVVYSDNGTNFKGAASAFALIDFEKIFLEAREHITWKFIPPNAPWWGGWWERLVGMMKNILKKTLGRPSLSYEEMITALCNCEAILNERPLTTVSSDPSLTPLTPVNFLKEIKSSTLPDLKMNPNSNSLQQRLQYIQTVQEAFRKRFRQEYLETLCTKQKHKKVTPLKEGDVVLIGDDDKKDNFGHLVE
ncbi:uncharacterized protein LOC118186567 [Stegodyphus dumicola]|uniref:uncharacterized protein LOC118186567 n=1 Tax=Stegodyphus dumicola TaxID=202533 RepID=UPI0015AB1D87|nr:uncharacterized protein LOC118186567 [Stegodyphus dumicola]